jgi:CubicO group peptidase (beta-lactamase class C family)
MRLVTRLLNFVLCAPLAAHAATVAPAQVGLDAARLDRFAPLIEQRIHENRLAGAVLLIARHGKLAYVHNFGMADRESGRAMSSDTIFRIYSMSKPIVAVAAMMLYEQGKFDLRDPVANYIPAFADMKVAVTKTDPATGHATTILVPATRQITVLDLLRHTSGLGYYFTKNADGKPYYKAYGIDDADTNLTLAAFVQRLAAAPLINQPGTIFYYSYSVDVLGRLIEIWSGKALDAYLADAIFAPLGMHDTGFYVPASKRARLATLYTPNPPATPDAEGIAGLGGPIVRVPSGPGPQDQFNHKPALFSGGGGLVSTPADYARFAMMLAGGGALGGVRLLGPKTVELIHADVLGDIPRGAGGPWPGDGFGLTVEVSRGPGPTGTNSSAGEFDWAGVGGTSFFVDPHEELTAVLMMQVIPGTPYWGRMLRQMTEQAVIEP